MACSRAPTALPEPYHGTIKRFGVDIGFTKEAHVIWLVFAPGQRRQGRAGR